MNETLEREGTQELNPTTHWLDGTWTGAVGWARRHWSGSPLERIDRLVSARAGSSALALFRSGELGRLAQLPEDDLHDAIEAGIAIRRFGAESHPMAVIFLENFPEYLPPAPEPTPVPDGFRAGRRTRRGVTSWVMERAK